MHKRTISIMLTLILTVAAFAGCGGNGAGGSGSAGEIRIGSKDFTENEIVAELYSLALEDAGYDVTRVYDISSSLIHQSIVSDEIDLYPEYTGTGLLSILQEDLMTDPDEVYNVVKEKYEEKFQLTWLDYAQANDGQGIFVSKEISDSLGIRTISDLQAHASEIRFASQGEFDERDDGIPGLTRVYGEFNWKSSKVYDNGLKYEVIEKGEADASPAYTTEGQLSGGQQQRIGLARALVTDPKIMLLDEPFGAIDAITRLNLQNELKRLHEGTKKTFLLVTHDINEAFKLGTRVMIMNEGRLLQFDTPAEIVRHPADDFVDILIRSARDQEEFWEAVRE